MDKAADLHIHTDFSDSTFTPDEVVKESLAQGLACIAVTDHDTIDGIPPAWDAARGTGLEVLPGIEFSCEWQKKDIHMLAYLVDIRDEQLRQRLVTFQDTRVERIHRMIGKLKEQGIDNITPDEVMDLTKSDAVGRPHLAALLVRKGWVPDMRAAFDRYLAEDRPAYVPKYKQTPYEAIDLIHRAGGIAVLAHPAVTGVDELIAGFADAGLDGLEVYYPNCFSGIVKHYEGLAKKYGLITTGGSDAHGEDRSHSRIGDIRVPYEIVAAMKARQEQYR